MSNLQIMRRKRGLTQAELAERSQVSLRIIQHYEQRYRDINRAEVRTVVRLADALHCDVKDIIE